MSAYSDKVIADGAVAYWRLGETTGLVANSSVGNFPGTISGGVTLNQPGALSDGNSAMAFDGVTGKIVTTASIPVLCTIEAWVRFTGNNSQSPYLSNFGGAGGIYVGVNGSNKACLFGVSSTASVTSINDSQWHHVVFVLKNPGCDLYLDGVLEKSQPLETRNATGPAPSIGWDSTNAQFWLGLIDEVAIYPTALTPQQIAEHYNLRNVTLIPKVGLIPLGVTTNIQRFVSHALPARLSMIESSVALELSTSLDGPWMALPASKLASGGFIRCMTSDALVMCKRFK